MKDNYALELLKKMGKSRMLRKIMTIVTICSLTLPAVYAAPTDRTSPSKPAWVGTIEGVQPTATPAPGEEADATPMEASPIPTAAPERMPAVKQNLKVPILMYHHITTEKFDKSNSISLISPNDFRRHMTAIKVHYTPISLREYYNYVQCTDGSVTLPENPIVVTFDDGYSSNYEIAYPILKELNIPATIFIVTDTVGEQAGGGKVNYSHFTWEEAKIMEESGLIDIQSHTHDHVKLAELHYNDMIRELRKSKYLIETNLGRECDMIAFPYGSYNDKTVDAARKAGYKVQVLVGDNTSGEDYEVNLTDDGVENLKRITVAGSMGNVDVLELIRKAMALVE